jgi:hypothetical protein
MYYVRSMYVHKPFDIQKDEREHLGIEHRINTLIVVLFVLYGFSDRCPVRSLVIYIDLNSEYHYLYKTILSM